VEDCSEVELIERKAEVQRVLRESFLKTDGALLQMCRDRGGLDFASSTGVAALFWHHMLSVAHLGDSRACIARLPEGAESLHCEWLTVDHKPDQPLELKRIQDAGGSLVYLHGNKPFIRGGDFLPRQAMGHHPKQLNYSRAFGGKDLKPFGLSADPSISHRQLTPEDKFVLIASDGLWDTLPLKTICALAWQVQLDLKANPAKGAGVQMIANEIVAACLKHMPLTTVRDNVSVVVIMLDWETEKGVPSQAAYASPGGSRTGPRGAALGKSGSNVGKGSSSSSSSSSRSLLPDTMASSINTSMSNLQVSSGYSEQPTTTEQTEDLL
jgi:protein phosphatase PTC2/3